MEYIIKGEKGKLIRHSLIGMFSGCLFLTFIYRGNEKSFGLLVFIAINLIMYLWVLVCKFRCTPFEFLFLDKSVRYYTTNFLGKTKCIEIDYSHIKEVKANYVKDEPNNVVIEYLDKRKNKIERKKLFLIYLNEPQKVVLEFKDAFDRLKEE